MPRWGLAGNRASGKQKSPANRAFLSSMRLLSHLLAIGAELLQIGNHIVAFVFLLQLEHHL